MTWEHSDNYLIHYGVKGQKHGQRRYQNEDGSLTAEGRDHYGVGDPRRAGGIGLHDKQGNKVRVSDNLRKAYSKGHAKGIGKAAFRMLFKKKGSSSSGQPARGLGENAQKKKPDESQDTEKPKKTSKQQKMRKATKIFANAVKIGAAAAVVGYGIKNRQKIKEAASLIADIASDLRPARKARSNYSKAIRTQAKADRLRRQSGYVKDRMTRAKKLDRKAEAYRSSARQAYRG